MQNNYKQLLTRLKKYSAYGILIQALMLAPFFVSAQGLTVSGTVTSGDDGTTLPGVSVVVKGTNVGTTTDVDGKYTLQISDADATLVFSFIGFMPQEVGVASRTVIDVALAADIQQLNEVVVVAYGTQQKVTLTGSVASIKGQEMLRTKNENPTNMLTGRVAGVRVWQKSSEPGTYNTAFDIRGFEGGPLMVIDGIPRTMEDFQRLNPSDIEDVSVLKDGAGAIYGVRAASGVVLVTTKKGSKGKTTVSYNGSFTLQKPAGLPRLADAYQTMTLYNEQARNDVSEPSNVIYGPDKFEAFRTGERRSTDWNDLVISDLAPQTQHDISISGGNEKTQFYVGGGYLYQEGIFKSGDLNYDKYNMRTNVTTELTKGLSFNINLAGIVDQRNTPYSSAVDIIRNYWAQGVLFPAYADPDNTMLSYEGLNLQQNTVAMMTASVSGYRKYQSRTFQSSAALNYDFGTVSDALNGLSAKAMLSYDYGNRNNTFYRREYYQYVYDENTDTYVSALYNLSSPNQMRREFFDNRQILGQFLLNYNRTFGDHKVVGLVGWEAQNKKGDNFFSQRNLAFAMEHLLAGVNDAQLTGMSSEDNDLFEYGNEAIFGRANYTYADRYIAEFQFRYDGSSKFVEDNQWGFFPSGSIGWRLSEESFFKSIDALSFVDQLKFRASYGVTANDGDMNYEWYPGYKYPAISGNAENGYYNQYAPGYMFSGQFIYGVQPFIANEKLTWWTAHSLNFGVDFEGWNGLFGVSLDYFDRRRKGIPARRGASIPTVVGAEAPIENLDSDQTFGFDLELSHRNRIGDVAYRVKGIATVARRKWLVGSANGNYGNSYYKWRRDNLNQRYQGVQFGYESDGRYTSWEDIWSYPIYKDNDVLPGDYKYQDWNGDGEINSLDEHPFAFDQTPWLNFSFSFDANYKNFDLAFLFQGTALGSMQYQEPLYAIWGTNGGGTLEQYLDRWHPVDPNASLYDPETEWVGGYYGYTGNYPIQNSDFNRVSTAYLRLKSLELGYTLPKTGRALSVFDVRVFANAYNLFTITDVKFVDPEHPDSDLGRLYPLNKTYTIGVSAKF